jgi:transcriptional regulator with XRE-family HTH domain
MTKSKRMISKIELLYLKKVGVRLRQIREKKGYTLKYVIKKTNIYDLEIIENGTDIDFEKVFILCNFYNIDVTEIFNKRN